MSAPGEATFLVAEEEALRNFLKGLTVTDGNSSTRPVGVWFGQPDPELRTQKYPYITIDLLGITEAKERVMVRYGPMSNYTIPGNDESLEYEGYYPTPVYLSYQIATWSRQPRHDRQIISQLMHRQLLPRFSQLAIPVDGTARRLNITGFAKRDTGEGEKRLFRNVWTVEIASELFHEALEQIYRVQSVNINDSDVLGETVPPDAVLRFDFP